MKNEETGHNYESGYPVQAAPNSHFNTVTGSIEKVNNFIIKWHRHAELSLLIHFLGFLLSIAILAGLSAESKSQKMIWLIVFMGWILLNLFIFLYSFYYGWNTAVYLNEEKIWSKIKGKQYEWRWEDMTECKIHVYTFTRVPYLVLEIITGENYKNLKISWHQRRYKQFMEICPNEIIKGQLKKAMEN